MPVEPDGEDTFAVVDTVLDVAIDGQEIFIDRAVSFDDCNTVFAQAFYGGSGNQAREGMQVLEVVLDLAIDGLVIV